MRLFIAEKPSMGRELARCMPPPHRKADGYIETGGGVVTWCYGHILRQAEPEEYEARYKSWRAEDLPILPKAWKLIVDEKAAAQFAVVKKFIERATEIVHAGDPDREGQLLVDEVLDYVGNKKPVQRLLLNALDDKSIKEALENLRSNADFFNLKQSALARARADWLIGMNLSRAYTLAARRAGHMRLVLPIGRVKTPTVALVVRREREIADFRSVEYYTIKAEFTHANGMFKAQWRPAEDFPGLDAENRLIDKAAAENMLTAFLQEPRAGEILSCQKTQKKESAPLPFSLSSLQVLAGKAFGYDPQLVLDTAQSLYEKKLTTYPRSDCEYLPLNQFKDAKAILSHLSAAEGELSDWAKGADASKKSRAWDDKKITAHHAIIPTTVKANLAALGAVEKQIYQLIARGYIAQFYPLHIFDQTKVELLYHGEKFTANGRTEKDLGWKILYQSKKDEEAKDEKEEDEVDGAIPPMKKKDIVRYEKGELFTRTTKPPQRFTAATLLAGMKEIHKYVKDPNAKKQLKDVYGIGTEATRATIIDDLIKRKFLLTEGKKKVLKPSPAAELLVDSLPDEMTYPDSTAIWEDRLHSMAAGEGSLAEFLKMQEDFAARLCQIAAAGATIRPPEEGAGRQLCPRCKSGILRQRKGKNGIFWGCTNYPKCRMSCDDKNGAPDLEAAARRAAFPSHSAQRSGEAQGRGGADFAPSDRGDYAPTAEEMAELNALFPPMLSASEMARNGGARNNWHEKTPKPSAKPMEEMKKSSAQGAREDSHLCPKCGQPLRLMDGRNGKFWGCSKYPRCTATYDDDGGAPRIT